MSIETRSGIKTIFENSSVKVYMNPSNEVFVEGKTYGKPMKPNPTVRISVGGADIAHIIVTAQSCNMTPWSVNGLPAIEVRSR
jgi:hypothetical protein